MEKIIEMLVVIGILFTPMIMLVAFFYILWYGGLLFDWILDNLFGLTDLLVMLTSYSGGYSHGFSYQGFSSNQDSRREEYYQDFKFKDIKQPGYKIEDPEGYYKILEVDYNAGHEEIVTAYHRLAMKYHPDVHPENEVFANEMMKKINAAKEVLTDLIKRAEYDEGWK